MHKTYTKRVTDKFMIALLREKNQKYKIFSGNRNLEINSVNKLVSNNFMENFITKVVNIQQFGMVCRHVWSQNTTFPCGSCPTIHTDHYYTLIPPYPMKTWILLGISPTKRNWGDWSCFSVLTCRTLFSWATRNQIINKTLTKLQRLWGQNLFEDY